MYDPQQDSTRPYDPLTAPPVFGNEPTTGYPDSQSNPGYQGQQPGYAGQQQPGYAGPPPPTGGYGYTTPPMPYGPPVAPRNGAGVAALVLGILGITFCMLTSMPAIICGAIGVKNAKEGLADNRGVAMGGLVLGIIGTSLLVLLVLFYVGMFAVFGLSAGTTPSSPPTPSTTPTMF